MPSILTYSTVHFNFLPLWSLHSSAQFPLTDHEDQTNHTLHTFTCHNQKCKPFGSSINSWILVSLVFYISPNLINYPSFSACINLVSLLYLLLFCIFCAVPSQRSSFSLIPCTFIHLETEIMSSSILLLTSVILDHSKSQIPQGSFLRLYHYTLISFSSLYLTHYLHFRPQVTVFLFTHIPTVVLDDFSVVMLNH